MSSCLSPGIVVSHPTGNTNVRHVLTALAEAGMLEAFFTTLAVFPGSTLGALSRMPGFAALDRRRHSSIIRSCTKSFPLREVFRLMSVQLGWAWPIRHESGIASIDRVFRSLDRRTAQYVHRHCPGGVYAYEDGALESFLAAKMVGARRIYDLPTNYWKAVQRILSEEVSHRPEWACTMIGLADSPAKLQRKDEELALAEHVVVASSFTRSTLYEAGMTLPPISVIPYGADDLPHERTPLHSFDSHPLRVLFVGSLSQRKGVADLLDAVGLLGSSVSLTLIGRRPAQSCAPLDRALCDHQWHASLPRSAILQVMANHDVLVFPSLCDGFGLVITEALSQGLPVITTPHTCGPDVITHGVDGFIVPIRDPEAIASSLKFLYHDRDKLEVMRIAARDTASRLTWARYRAVSVDLIAGLLSS